MIQTKLQVGQHCKVLKQGDPKTPGLAWIPMMESLIGEVGIVHSFSSMLPDADVLLVFPDHKGLFAFPNDEEVLKHQLVPNEEVVTNTLPPRTDINDKVLENFDLINIHDSVNGENIFIVLDCLDLDIRYAYDPNRKYEYDSDQLLDGTTHKSLNSPGHFHVEQEWEIVGSLLTDSVDDIKEKHPYV